MVIKEIFVQTIRMNIYSHNCRVLCISILALMFVISEQTFICASNLDDIYTPLVAKDKYLYQAKITNFDMVENGSHGSASFSDFDSNPSLVSAFHSLRFSPVSGLELEAGYEHFFPREYTRSTFDGPTPSLDTVQDYTLHFFQDYFFKLRYRKDVFETYIQFQEKRQKAKTDAVLLLNNTVSFDDINAHYEDLNFGVRYLSEEKVSQTKSSYFQITRPLLADRQINLEMNVGFKNGKVKNVSDIYLGSTLFIRNYFHQLRPHFIPSVLLRYGINDYLELESGFSYTSPFKYNYEYKQFNPTNENFITGTYNIENNLKVPLQLTYQPADYNISVMFSADFHYIKQRLDSWEKEVDNSITLYDVRKLRYFNTKPTLKLSYFHDADKKMSKDEFSSLTKQLLRRKQVLMSFQYQKDITSLLKADGNGALNVIDPYNVFLYPLDLFVSGSEYGPFFLGNKTTRAASVQPQNYYLLETSLMYGVRDYLNVGLEVGYRSANSLHHFTVHDLTDRFYRFEPYYYFNFLADWQVKKNSLLSLKVHYVPQYKTFLETSIHPKQFEAETRYYEISLAWKILF